MVWFDGVSESIGKVMAHQSESSANSTLQGLAQETANLATTFIRPLMSETCGGCDDEDLQLELLIKITTKS